MTPRACSPRFDRIGPTVKIVASRLASSVEGTGIRGSIASAWFPLRRFTGFATTPQWLTFPTDIPRRGVIVVSFSVPRFRAIRIPWAFVCAWALILALEMMNRRSACGVALALVAAATITLLVMRNFSSCAARTDAFGHRTWRIALALACAVQVTYGGIHLRRAAILDIGWTTLRAGEVMIHGGNPFSSFMDGKAAGLIKSVTNAADAKRYGGYKYLPVMATAYMPLGLPFKARGLIVTNILLMGGLLVGIWTLTRASATEDAARWAVIFFGILPLPMFQLYAKGVTDIVAVLPLVFSLALTRSRPRAAGLLIGLSLSAKLIPAALLLPFFMPSDGPGRKRFLLWSGVGLLPTIAYFALGPQAFVDNIVIFNLIRPVDPTSWLHGAPRDLIFALHAAFGVAWLVAVWSFVRNPPELMTRCGVSILFCIAALLVGPDVHENYMLWWLPFFAVLVGHMTAVELGKRTGPALENRTVR